MGILIPYENGNYIFILSNISVDIFNKLLMVTFVIADPNGVITNKTYTVTKRGERFDIYMNYNTIRGYYVMLCEDLGIDPSVVPEDMSL